jgi:hypothetical protein
MGLIFPFLPSISLFNVHDGGLFFSFLLSLDYTTCGQNERTAGTSGGRVNGTEHEALRIGISLRVILFLLLFEFNVQLRRFDYSIFPRFRSYLSIQLHVCRERHRSISTGSSWLNGTNKRQTNREAAKSHSFV